MENFTETALKNFEKNIIKDQQEIAVDGSLALKEESVMQDAASDTDSNVVSIEETSAASLVNDNEQDKLFRAGEVAEKIGISTTTLRGYASEVSNRLTGKLNSAGERLYTVSDIELIRKMYEYCRDNNVTKSFAKEMLFSNKGNNGGFSNEAMDRMMGKLDELSSVIRTLSDTLLLQNDVIKDLREELDAEKSEKSSYESLLKRNTDSIKSFVGDALLKTKKEISEQIGSSFKADVTEEPAFKEVQAQVKKISKVLDKVETRTQTSVTADMLSQAIRDNNEVLLKSIKGLSKPDNSLKEENRKLRQQLKDMEKTLPLQNEVNEGDILSLKNENEELRSELDRTLLAVRNMNSYINELENGKSDDDSACLENKNLKNDLDKALLAIRNMDAHIRNIETENNSLKEEIARVGSRNEAEDADLFDENERLYDEIEALEAQNSALKDNLDKAMDTIESLSQSSLAGNGRADDARKNRKRERYLNHRDEQRTSSVKHRGLLPSYEDEDMSIDGVEIESIKKSARKVPAVSVLHDIDEYDDTETRDEYHDEIDELPTDLFGVDDVDDAVDDVAVSSPKKNNSKQHGTSDKSSGNGRKKKFLFF